MADVVAATVAAGSAELAEPAVQHRRRSSRVASEALDFITTLAEKRLDVRYLDPEQGDVRDTAADTTRARQLLGFQPSTSLEEGLAAEFEWICELMRTQKTNPRPAPAAPKAGITTRLFLGTSAAPGYSSLSRLSRCSLKPQPV